VIPLPRLRHTPLRWVRRHRHTARLRLTALYGGLFLFSGAALLALTYLLAQATDKASYVELNGNALRTIPESAVGHLHQFQVAVARYQSSRDLSHELIESGIALVIMAVVAAVLGWIVAGRALRPLSTITATARRISATNLHERLALDTADEEFQQLGETLNTLFERLEASFAAQRHFIANASHELRTPLTRERTLLQVALAGPSTSDMWHATGQKLLASNREQESILEALLALASSEGEVERHDPIDLAVVAQAVLGANHLDADRLGVNVEATIGSASLEGDPDLIERLVANLLDNAIGHNVEGGRVHLSIGTTDGHAVFSLSNTGPVIPPTEIDRLFQPFQRLDPRRAGHNTGHGLGLSIVKAIAAAHGANVVAQAPPSGGLMIEITFPPSGCRMVGVSKAD
jgi:signal transduction histidine kinase